MYAEIPIRSVIIFRGGPFGKYLGQKGGALMNRISALKKETQETPPLAPPPREDMEKTAVREPGSQEALARR